MKSNLTRVDGASLARLYPDDAIVDVTHLSRQADETTFVTGGVYQGYRKPLDKETAEAINVTLGVTALTWVVFADNPATEPRVFDQITDPDGATWTVQMVTKTYFGTVYNLACIKNLA